MEICTPLPIYAIVAILAFMVFFILSLINREKNYLSFLTDYFASYNLLHLCCYVLLLLCVLSLTTGIINANCVNDNKGLAWLLTAFCVTLNITFITYMFKHLN